MEKSSKINFTIIYFIIIFIVVFIIIANATSLITTATKYPLQYLKLKLDNYKTKNILFISEIVKYLPRSINLVFDNTYNSYYIYKDNDNKYKINKTNNDNTSSDSDVVLLNPTTIDNNKLIIYDDENKNIFNIKGTTWNFANIPNNIKSFRLSANLTALIYKS